MTDTATVSSPLASLAKAVWWMLLLRGILAVITGVRLAGAAISVRAAHKTA